VRIIHIFMFEKEPLFPFLLLSAKQGNHWYHLFKVFGMTQSLPGSPALAKSALYH